MRIIIAGDGEVGLYLAQELNKEDHHITMIVPNEDLVKTLENQTDVLAPSNSEVLTIYTCTGWLDQNRFIVKAVPTG